MWAVVLGKLKLDQPTGDVPCHFFAFARDSSRLDWIDIGLLDSLDLVGGQSHAVKDRTKCCQNCRDNILLVRRRLCGNWLILVFLGLAKAHNRSPKLESRSQLVTTVSCC